MNTPFEIASHSRAAREGGWTGRRRWYRCRKCNAKLKVDVAKPLSGEDRICPECKAVHKCYLCGRIGQDVNRVMYRHDGQGEVPCSMCDDVQSCCERQEVANREWRQAMGIKLEV